MSDEIHFTKENLGDLKKFLSQNREISFKSINLLDSPEVEKCCWKGLKKRSEAVTAAAMAYQRLLRIFPVPDEEVILGLLERNIHSAVQIASMTGEEFISQSKAAFEGRLGLAELVYKNALKKKSQVVIGHLNRMQQAQPHSKAARFN